MDRLQRKLTPTVLIAVVLVLGLLSAASAALLKNASAGGSESGGAITADSSLQGDTPQLIVPGGEMPRTLPMPERGPRRDADGAESGFTRSQLRSLLIETFGQDVPVDDKLADAHFVTRGDVAVAVVRALGLEEIARDHAPSEVLFRDVPVEHEAFGAVAMLHRLGLYPFHVGTLFVPDDRVQPAEVRFTVETAQALESVRGPIIHVNAPARTVSVEWTPRHATAYIAGDGTLVVRNGLASKLEQLQPGDDVHVVADGDGELFVAVASGPEQAAGVSEELLGLVRELATPEQLAAIISRDWDRAVVELKGSVYNQLLERGATPEEAAALLAQDWSVVEERSKARLTELISSETDVNEELVRAILDRDWDTALGHIEVEVLEYVLNYLVV